MVIWLLMSLSPNAGAYFISRLDQDTTWEAQPPGATNMVHVSKCLDPILQPLLSIGSGRKVEVDTVNCITGRKYGRDPGQRLAMTTMSVFGR